MPSKQKYITIKNVTQNNLKGLDIEIPRNRLTVITGVSGSGKSTLAFDTLYAEGQRRFVESLSSYTRQFLERMGKPEADSIVGLPPAIAIAQKVPYKNPRSTVGTITEIYDYLRVLFARISKIICSKCGSIVQKHTPDSIVNEILSWDAEEKIYILFALDKNVKDYKKELLRLRTLGFDRFIIGNSDEIYDKELTAKIPPEDIFFLVDRVKLSHDQAGKSRLVDSVELALNVGKGRIIVRNLTKDIEKKYSIFFECTDCNKTYKEPDVNLFSFNNPKGACTFCNGLGKGFNYSEDLLIPDKNLSLQEKAVAPFRYPSTEKLQKVFIEMCLANNIPIDKPYSSLSPSQKEMIWQGKGKFIGILGYLNYLDRKNYKIQNRVIASRYKATTTCMYCGGSRLSESARQAFINGENIPSLSKMHIADLNIFLKNITLNEYEKLASEQILLELISRTQMLCDIGLEYLTLSRESHTLSGGEFQRINLSSALASSLIGTLYILDEPSIGLHQQDTEKLINIIYNLRNIGNTIIVVEHDPEIISKADFILDMGPGAGNFGGEIVYSGNYENLLKCEKSVTARAIKNMNNADNFPHKSKEPKFTKKNKITIIDATENNLKIKKLDIPLNCITVVTGVSGSGKSTLVNDVIYPGIKQSHGTLTCKLTVGAFKEIIGCENIDDVEMIDQLPIGRSSRSTPVTYLNIFDDIRDVFAATPLAKQLGYKPGYFSFNVPGGRCETCEGQGYIEIDMQFLPDIKVACETCEGTRYKKEIRSILYKDKSIVDVLNMTIDEALILFADTPKITNKLQLLSDVGVGYLKLGQSSNLLSGGEAQRIKLAAHINLASNKKTMYIFDEPTTGLHLADIDKLKNAIQHLINLGNSVLIIEHNLSIISFADWIIDLGPGAGKKGGTVVGEGSPKKIAKLNTATGKVLNNFFNNK